VRRAKIELEKAQKIYEEVRQQAVERIEKVRQTTVGDMIDGTLDAVITQHQQASVLNCVRIFTNLRDGREPLTGVDPVGIHIVLRENLP